MSRVSEESRMPKLLDEEMMGQFSDEE